MAAVRRRPRSAPPPPAPRRFPQARAQASYERILTAAFELYGERGYHGTQTPDIAERAGISVGGLYRYFRDKHQIFVELMHRLLEQNRQRQDAMIREFEKAWDEGSVDVRQAVDAVVDFTWSATHAAPPDLLRTYMAMSYQDPAFGALREEYDRYERRAAARVIAKVASRSQIRSALAAAKVVDLAVETIAIWAALHPGYESRGVKAATREMIRSFFAPLDTSRR